MTPVVASHNLRELEDICDHVGLLHKGGILFSRDLSDMMLGMHKLQPPLRCRYSPRTSLLLTFCALSPEAALSP